MMFDLSLFSKYRTELMGVATLLIIVCHMPAHGVVMPLVAVSIIKYGGLGCDMFLFLSGMGIWFSLQKQKLNGMGILQWYKKRYLRVFVPYLLIIIPVFTIEAFLNEWTIGRYLWRVSTLSFWTEGWGAWFISLILVLYLLAPWLYILLSGKRKWEWLLIIIILIWVFDVIVSSEGILEHVRFGVCRIPSYIIGFAIAEEIKKGTKIPLWSIILTLASLLIFGVLLRGVSLHVTLFWIEGLFLLIIMTVAVHLLRNQQWISTTLKFMGAISLESYCTNIFVLSLFKNVPWQIGSVNFNYGNWVYYVLGTACCIIISTFVNKSSLFLNSIINPELVGKSN